MVGAEVVDGGKEVEASLERPSLAVGLGEQRAHVRRLPVRARCRRFRRRFRGFVRAGSVVLVLASLLLLRLLLPRGGILRGVSLRRARHSLRAVEQGGVPNAPVEVRVELELWELAHVTRQRHHPRVVVVVDDGGAVRGGDASPVVQFDLVQLPRPVPQPPPEGDPVAGARPAAAV